MANEETSREKDLHQRIVTSFRIIGYGPRRYTCIFLVNKYTVLETKTKNPAVA
jgi:hypothetical protein